MNRTVAVLSGAVAGDLVAARGVDEPSGAGAIETIRSALAVASGRRPQSAPVPSMCIVIGIVRRPQDHNGVIDDVLTLLENGETTSLAAAAGCALASATAALLDGWAMESAVMLAVQTGRKGAAFGRKLPGVDVPRMIEESVERAERNAGLNLAGPPEVRGPFALVPAAIGIAYARRHAHAAVRSVMESPMTPAARRVTASLAAALCAAYDPGTLPDEWERRAAGAAAPVQLRSVAEQLLSMRSPFGLRRT